MKPRGNNSAKSNEYRSAHSSYYHYGLIDQYHDSFHLKSLSQLYEFIVNAELVSLPVTDQEIQFKSLALNSSKNALLDKLGPPAYIIENEEVPNHTILFYNLHVKEYPVIAQLHLLDEIFFYGVYIFKYYVDKKFSDVEEVIRLKYFENSEDQYRPAFRDHHDNRLLFTRKMYQKLHYVSGNPDIKARLTALYEQHQRELADSQNKDLESLKKDL